MPLTDDNLNHLYESARWSREKLEPFIDERDELIRHYVGPHWSDGHTEDPRPLNMIEMFITVMLTQLSGRSPRVSIGTKYEDVRPTAYSLESQTNVSVREMKLGNTLESAVLDDLFCIGLTKLGEQPGGQFEFGGRMVNRRKQYAEPIDLVDWFHDMAARRWNQVHFKGHRYRMDR